MKLIHSGLIQFIILIIILIIYYSGKIPESKMTICLLGSYIVLNGTFSILHGIYHRYNKSNYIK
jgi:hypothetical protein